MAVRVLVLSAPVGESHAAMAHALARDLERCREVASVVVLNEFSVLGTALGGLLERGFRHHLGSARRSYDLAYRLFTGFGPARRFGELALCRLGGPALAARIAAHDPDIVVSTYPVLNPVLARLRAANRLRCPAAAVVDPLGGLGFWVAPGIDLHLLNYPEALAEVQRRLGPAAAVPVVPLVREGFLAPAAHDGTRRHWGVAGEHRMVVVSGGGWGAGDLEGAIDTCLAIGGLHVIAVAGRNERARQTLQQRFANQPAVTVLGFTDEMPALLRAADVLVTATAGLSCVEARLCGCPIVCYGFAVGHVRDNTRALAEHRLARVASTLTGLRGELEAALAAGRAPPPPAPAPALARAAEVTVALARAHEPARTRRR